jgi:chromate transporter
MLPTVNDPASGPGFPPSEPTSLGEIFRLFLRLGMTAFGGPAAHLSLMQSEAVERRKWMTRERFLDLVGACNLLPGPGSTQVAMALGYSRRKWPGLLVAGVCFILPASLATLGLAWSYVRFGNMAITKGILYGAKPVMLAILAQAVWKLGGSAWRTIPLAFLSLVCAAAALFGLHPLLVLIAAGGLTLLAKLRPYPDGSKGSLAVLATSFSPAALPVGSAAVGGIGLLSLLAVFLKLGVVVFGSGYVLLAFLQADLVARLHWITPVQLLDAVTAGQLTPGPVFATATFLGYLLRGWSGAALATFAIFLPSFVMAGLVGALAERIRASSLAGAFLDGVNAAAVALMASVALPLGRASLVDGWTWAMAGASALLLIRFKVNATWLILSSAGLGLLLQGRV